MLIDLTETWLEYDDSEGHVRQANGYDIVFTDKNNDVKLDWEIEEYNGRYNATHGTLVAWVRIPTLNHTAPNTTIRLWYGNNDTTDWSNKTGVWDTNYTMVQHLNETSGTQYDSTENNNDGTPSGTVNKNVAGKIDGADEFGGGHVNCGNNSSLNITGALTIEAWVYPTVDTSATFPK